ncbi:2-aminoadipate transaminase [Mycobacterium frederiksbergense]|uniref:2-aminoadipate transaminase n=1 Tax=Mycolicibacterium frederiksbergense TaxID=117567 RepID=A0ABT6KXT8_9MYCO|nr:PLP-dependent aminotransferase family protein [Mycolicibacterium frederiksbergense]MDH6195516.1 2-aminoadipate transaminase [Mycolicibacterium frederiksbergense]
MTTSVQIPFAAGTDRLVGSVIDASTALLAQQQHDIVRFAMGAPSEDLMPITQLDEAFAARGRHGRYDYGETEGEPALREEILRLSAAMGVDTSDDRLLVTTGGMQGLDLIFKIFVEPGDLVVVESPTYTNGNATALSYGAHTLGARVDDDGLVVEELPELIERAGRTPKVIYTIPNFQNPSGVTLSRARRELLLELAERWGSVILDDDPYGRLRFHGDQIASFAELAPRHPLVCQVRTFSKIIAPGLRCGWIDVDPQVRALAINAKQAMDTCSSVAVQSAVADYLATGHLDSHVERLLPIYRQRKDAMRRAIDEHLGELAVATDPDGGFFLWLTLTGRAAGIDTEDLFPDALRRGVAYIPGPAFTTDGSMRNSLRLCFATSTPERIEEGIARLAQTVHGALDGGVPAESTGAELAHD